MTKIPAYGPENARVMVVGEAPGADEVREGRPFVGKAGQTLRKALFAVGIDPNQVYYTNICKYRPPANKLRAFFNDQGIPNQQVLEGLVELDQEIRRVKPNIIIACGNYPLWALTGKARWIKVKQRSGATEMAYAGISDWRGTVVDCTMVPGTKVLPTFHPSFINQEGYNFHGIWGMDLSKAAAESAYPELRRMKRQFYLDPQGKERWEVRDRLLADKTSINTFDIEYIGSKLLCVGITNSREWAASIAIRRPEDLLFVRSILMSGNPLNAQNAVFDCSILEWFYEMQVMQYLEYDTMLAAHAANPELPKALDFLISIYTDIPYYKDMVNWKLVEKGKQDPHDLLIYNCFDAFGQHEVMEEQKIYDLVEPEVRRTFEFEMSLVQPLWNMSSKGVRVDAEEMTRYRKLLDREIREYQNALNILAGRELNVKSTKQKAAFLVDQLGCPVLKMNKTGPAMDDKTLAATFIKAENDVQRGAITIIREITRRRDLISKFLEIQFDTDVGPDGTEVHRMRGHYNPAGTVTGRLASRKFYPTNTGGNQQNIPTDKIVRSMFIPDPPKVFVYADLERAESLVVAYLTQDPEMLRVHRPGIDAHKELATRLFGVPIDEVTEDQRYLGKRTRHAGNYMQGPRTFMTGVNQAAVKTGVSITYQEAKKFIDVYKEVHPFLKNWWSNVEAELWKTHTLYNLIGPEGKGRKRIFYERVGSILPEAVAYVPQSTVGDTLNIALLNLIGVETEYMQFLGLWEQYREWATELAEYGYEPLMQIHDAVGFQIYENQLERALFLVQKLMTIPITIPSNLETFAIPVEIKYGPNWGHLELWKPQLAA